MKSKYRFFLRPLGGSTKTSEVEELVAGPFTPLEAAEFGQTEAVRRTMNTGESWLCDYLEITVVPPRSPWRLIVFALIFLLIGFVGARFALGRLQ